MTISEIKSLILTEIQKRRELEAKATASPWSIQVINKGSDWRHFAIVSPDGIIANIDEGKVSDLEANAALINASRNDYLVLLDALEFYVKQECSECHEYPCLLKIASGLGVEVGN